MTPALRQLFGEPPVDVRPRRLDARRLELAARAIGFPSVKDAVRAALGTLAGSPMKLDALAAEIVRGTVPGSMTRRSIARLLDVNEHELWPFSEDTP